MSYRSHNLDINERDFSEAPRLTSDSSSRGLIAGSVLGALLLLGLLVYGSMPDLSPQEIIAMDGYEGEQPTRHIFNLQSMDLPEDEITPPSGIKASNSTDAIAARVPEKKPEMTTGVAVLNDQVASAEIQVATVTASQQAPIVVEPLQDPAAEPIVVAKVEPRPVVVRPAAAVSNTQADRVESASATTPLLDESPDTIVLSSVVADEPAALPLRQSQPADSTKLLPLRSILKDFTKLKEEPSARSKTLVSLGQGVVVTAFERNGDWVHIGTNDGSSVTGYVLDSALGEAQAR